MWPNYHKVLYLSTKFRNWEEKLKNQKKSCCIKIDKMDCKSHGWRGFGVNDSRVGVDGTGSGKQDMEIQLYLSILDKTTAAYFKKNSKWQMTFVRCNSGDSFPIK